ncbi:MAG: DUF3307 domain-containing protein [Candidatus Peribacteraceae bacterium]|nr:DUF3307 domain-containing protein [Candidatus Peribacteraceae bacterium]
MPIFSVFDMFLIAHLIGDYIGQNNWMALNKQKEWLPLFAHTSLYGLAFAGIFMSVEIGLIAFVAHSIFDRIPVAEMVLQKLKGRSVTSVFALPPIEFPDVEEEDNEQANLATLSEKRNQMLYTAFTAPVYIVVDFLIHMVTTLPFIVWYMRYNGLV